MKRPRTRTSLLLLMPPSRPSSHLSSRNLSASASSLLASLYSSSLLPSLHRHGAVSSSAVCACSASLPNVRLRRLLRRGHPRLAAAAERQPPATSACCHSGSRGCPAGSLSTAACIVQCLQPLRVLLPLVLLLLLLPFFRLVVPGQSLTPAAVRRRDGSDNSHGGSPAPLSPLLAPRLPPSAQRNGCLCSSSLWWPGCVRGRLPQGQRGDCRRVPRHGLHHAGDVARTAADPHRVGQRVEGRKEMVKGRDGGEGRGGEQRRAAADC